jgi:glycosyltransferase involved in cell wall biosynthesis
VTAIANSSSRANQPLVTVAIPSKNRADCLRRCLAAVRAQSYRPIEIIVVDDGSVPPLAGLGSDVRVIRNDPSRGLCAARNQALAAALGDYVVFFDDDAEPKEPTLIARALAWRESVSSLGAIAFRQLRADGSPLPWQPLGTERPCYAPWFYTYGCMVDRRAVMRAGAFLEVLGIYGEEQELSLRLLDCGLNIVYDPTLSVVHHHEPVGRNERANQVRGRRNWTVAILLRYPLWMVVPALANYWFWVWRNRGRGGFDWAGFGQALGGVMPLIPYIRRSRSPVKLSTLRLRRRLTTAKFVLALPSNDATSNHQPGEESEYPLPENA